MHWKHTEVDRADRADSGGEQSINTLEVVRVVGTYQNLSGQDGTCPELLVLHIGPNGDGFGGSGIYSLHCHSHFSYLCSIKSSVFTQNRRSQLFPSSLISKMSVKVNLAPHKLTLKLTIN
jgi:hypothetical protein